MYQGYSYIYDGHNFRSQFPICLSTDLDLVLLYMCGLRKYTIVDIRNPDDNAIDVLTRHMELTNDPAVVGEIRCLEFYDNAQASSYLEANGELELVHHQGKVDPDLAMMTKKHAKALYVPAIVEDIIVASQQEIRTRLKGSMYDIKEVLLYLGRDPQFNTQRERLMEAMHTLEQLVREDQDDTDLARCIAQRHPIFFTGELDYREKIKSFKNGHAMDLECIQYASLPYT